MNAFAGAARRGVSPAVLIGALGLLAFAAVSGHGAKQVGPFVAVLAVFIAWQKSLLRWHSLVGLVLLVVLFVPIGRYSLPGNLPFNLELYRVVVALVVAIWIACLLVDPRVKLRSTPFDWPLLLLAGCILASEIANPSRVNPYSSFVAKTLTFYLSFWLVYYLTATTIRTRASVEFLLKLLAFGGSMIGLFAIVEQRTRFNVFDHLHSVLPFLTFETGYSDQLLRGGNLRVFGSAEHPIALGAVLIMLLPITVYFARTSSRKWWFGAVVDRARRARERIPDGNHDARRGDRDLSHSQAEGDQAAVAALRPGHRRRARVSSRRDRHLQGSVLPQGRHHRRAVATRCDRERAAGRRTYSPARPDDRGGRAPSTSR